MVGKIKAQTAQTKKAQSALEFLTTYGWAFLVILIMIGALSYFGVLDPGRFLPDKCLFGPGVGTCKEFAALGTAVNFTVVNSLGSNVVLNSVEAKNVRGVSGVCTGAFGTVTASVNKGAFAAPSGQLWASGEQMEVSFACTMVAGERLQAITEINYTVTGGNYNKTIPGDLAVKR